MSRKTIGLITLLCVSEVLGLVLGEWFYSLFMKTLPPLALSSFSQGAAHTAFLGYGLLAGLAVFVLAFVSALLSRFFPSLPPSPAAPSKTRVSHS